MKKGFIGTELRTGSLKNMGTSPFGSCVVIVMGQSTGLI